MNFKTILFFFVSLIILVSCKADLEKLQEFNKNSHSLINQDSVLVNFPDLINGKIAIIGYIFTNCYDICPLTTNNMRIIQEKVKEEKISNVEFVSISFDPDVDKPSKLKSFVKVRDLDLSNWEFLTGDKETIDKLMKDVGMVVVVADSTIYKDGSKSYYYAHTDRIQLIDQNGILRKNYVGSKIRIDEIVNDIKELSR